MYCVYYFFVALQEDQRENKTTIQFYSPESKPLLSERELTQLMSDHVLRDQHWLVVLSIMDQKLDTRHQKRQMATVISQHDSPNKIRQNGTSSGLCFDWCVV